MKKIIEDLYLRKLELDRSEFIEPFDPNKVQAGIKVKRSKKNDSLVRLEISVGEPKQTPLFEMIAIYSFVIVEDVEEEELVHEIMDQLQQRMEELLSIMTYETGYYDAT